MLYKINLISKYDNIYYDDEDNSLYFFNEVHYSMGFNVLNPYAYNSDDYNMFNSLIIEILRLYLDYKRIEFKNYINNCINNKNFYSCCFNGAKFTIKKSYFDISDFKIIY